MWPNPQFTGELHFLCSVRLFLCLSRISLWRYCLNNLVKCWGLGKKIKRDGCHIARTWVGAGSKEEGCLNLFHTMVFNSESLRKWFDFGDLRVIFLYPLKMSENYRFSDVFRWNRKRTQEYLKLIHFCKYYWTENYNKFRGAFRTQSNI